MPFSVQRPLVAQEWATQGFTVNVAPAQPLGPNLGITSMIDSFYITVPAAAANSIFIGGNPAVTTANGLELLAGTTSRFLVSQARQLYELQKPLLDVARTMCNIEHPEAIPFVVWDMSQIYVVAVAATVISFAPFKAMYI